MDTQKVREKNRGGEKRMGGEKRGGGQALFSDKKEVEMNVGQYRFSMDAGVIGVIHSHNRLNL